MGRRKILLPLAAVIAALGTLMVFMYAKAADSRAEEQFDAVQVLQAVKQIDSGESFDDAAQAGKFELKNVPKAELLDGYQTDLTGLKGRVATQTIFVGEQVTSNTWGDEAVAETSLAIPKEMMAISVNLTDPGRVSGFVTPGSDVSIFVTYSRIVDSQPVAQVLLDRVKVLGIGASSTITSTTTTKEGESTTEEIPRTLMTLALKQADAQRVIYAAANGQLSVGLLTKDTTLAPTTPTTEQNLFK